MKTRLLQFAGMLALLAVLGKFYAKPVLAQVRAAIVQDRDAVGRNLYQAVNICTNATNPCVISFPAVPAGKRLVITHVSAIAKMQSATALVLFELRGANNGVFQYLPPFATPGNFAGEFDFVTNQDVLAAYDVGEIPTVDVFAGGTFTVEASISGYMIDIP